ncbi:MAG: nitrogen regulation protein NR(II) [Gammaproteobacteria bacterium]|nr:nitrogen regulation protein NR(II) [Gammaproteobacteria bacterium]
MADLANTVLEHMTTAVLVVNDARKVCYMNSAAEALFGTSEPRSTGASLSELTFDDGSDAFTGFEETFETGQSITKRSAEFRLRDGTPMTVDLTASLLPSTNHLIIELQPLNRLLRINRDDHSLYSQETSRKLVRGLAHEVKNPLGGLRGAAQLLERELKDDALTEYTQIIINEADRLTDLVDRMLGPTRHPQIEQVNVHSVLEHVIRLVDAELPGFIEFERDYDPSLPSISADEAQIIQAFLNILRNAGQALEKTSNPRVVIKTRVVRQYTIGAVRHRMVSQIDIFDNGPGISSDMLDRIFFPMISGRADGTGLGLAITQTIVGQHHGMLECRSKPGETCFSVFLPLEEQINNELAETAGGGYVG